MEIQVTKKQLDEMKHAIGLDYGDKAYRNKFYTFENDKDWNDLVSKGLAKKGQGWEKDMAYFYLTKEGFAFLGIDIEGKTWEQL